MIKRIAAIFLCLLIILSALSQQKIRIELNTIPENTPANSLIFIAGSFNRWNPQDKKYQFQKNDKGYFIEFSLSPTLATGNKYEFKITRGGWDKVECTKEGKDVGNRTLNIETDANIEVVVEGWKDLFASSNQAKKSTAGKNVKIIDTAFFIPQLKRTRRVWVYVPPTYNSSDKKYPVLYMHDGQNVFDDATSFSGEWGVDEAIDTLGLKYRECIVVGIDNGADKRLNEYCPYDFNLTANKLSGKGEGNLYVKFLVKTLKPFIDKKYRTLKDKKNTFIAGSSMGGLISMYAVLKYPKKFGGAGVFSPAFWTAPKIFDDIKAKGKKVNSKIYFYAGDDEAESMVPMTLQAFNEMHRVSKSKMCEVIRAGGKHNEQRWRIEFPLFYEWIMKN